VMIATWLKPVVNITPSPRRRFLEPTLRARAVHFSGPAPAN